MNSRRGSAASHKAAISEPARRDRATATQVACGAYEFPTRPAVRSSRISMPWRPCSPTSSHGVRHVHAHHRDPLALRRSFISAARNRGNACRHLSSRAALYARARTKVARETRVRAWSFQPPPLTLATRYLPHEKAGDPKGSHSRVDGAPSRQAADRRAGGELRREGGASSRASATPVR